jgi:hypothetical protein
LERLNAFADSVRQMRARYCATRIRGLWSGDTRWDNLNMSVSDAAVITMIIGGMAAFAATLKWLSRPKEWPKPARNIADSCILPR